MENFITSLNTIFTEQELVTQINEDGDAIKSLALGEKSLIPVFGAAPSPTRGFVVLYHPIRIIEPQRPAIYELLARLHLHTPFGNFMYDFETNLVGLKFNVYADDEEIGFDNEEVKAQLEFGIMELDALTSVIHKVTSGQLTPEQAVEQFGEDDESPAEKPNETDPKNRLLDFLPGDSQNN